jgi:hypothetical protein
MWLASSQIEWNRYLSDGNLWSHSQKDVGMAARRTAEALFRPQTAQSMQPAVGSSSLAEHPVRKPRILPAIKPGPIHAKERATVVAREKPVARSIPPSHVARIRTWVQYGMTIRQVAQVYGVAVSVIQRLL